MIVNKIPENLADVLSVGYQLILEKDEVEKVTAGGIFLAEETLSEERGAMCSGTVRKIGPLAYSIHGGVDKYFPQGLEVGDTVYFKRYGGSHLPPFKNDPDDHSGYVIIDDEAVQFVIKRNKEVDNE